jgi:hypothetical protein
VSHAQPIRFYVGTAAWSTGRPDAKAYVEPDGKEMLRVYPVGVGGAYLAVSSADWDVLASVVADARAELSATTTLPGELPSAHLNRTAARA